jgi:hypothetical protein
MQISEPIKAASIIPSELITIPWPSRYTIVRATTSFAPEEIPTLRRRVTTFEYEYVRDAAIRLGFGGYSQDADSATAAYTPEF